MTRYVLLTALLALTACKTPIAVADQNFGFEDLGQQHVRLRFEREALRAKPKPPADDPDVAASAIVAPEADCDDPETGARRHRFYLPLQAWNGDSQPWRVDIGMFRVWKDSEPSPTVDSLPQSAEGLLAVIQPRGSADFELELIVDAEGAEPYAEYRIGFWQRNLETGAIEQTMERRITIKAFDDYNQAIRAALIGLAAVALVGAI